MASLLDRRNALASVWSREARTVAAVKLDSDQAIRFHGPPNVAADAAVVLVAVPDEAFAATIAALPADVRDAPERVWLHVSGASGAERWRGSGVCGSTGAAHPLMSFQGTPEDVERLSGCFMAIDGDEDARAAALWLADACGAQAGLVSGSVQRVAYHLAAVLASNGVYALLAAANHIVQHAGIEHASLGDGLASLAFGSAAGARERGVDGAATGPIVRGDIGTVRRHLEWMSEHRAELLPLYRELARPLVGIAERRGVRPVLLATLRTLLDGDA